MGMPMAVNLLQDGQSLTVYDINPLPQETLEGMGAKVAESPRQLASEVENIFVSLPDHVASEKVMLGENGVLDAAKPNQIVVDTTTSLPSVARKIADNARNKKVFYLDASVSGHPDGAASRSLIFMVGGEVEALNKMRPVMERLAKHIFYIGPSGMGNAMKLVNNAIGITNTVVLMEGLILGAKVGIPPAMLFDVISNSSGNSDAFQKKVPRILTGDFRPRFSLDLEYKDLFLVANVAAELQVPLFLCNVARELFEMAKAKGLGKEDNIALIKVLEEIAGVKVRK